MDWNIGSMMRRGARKSLDAGLKLPIVVRSLVGTLLVLLGALGFLPIVGFWMIPAGAVLVALDIPPLRRCVLDHLRRDKDRNALS